MNNERLDPQTWAEFEAQFEQEERMEEIYPFIRDLKTLQGTLEHDAPDVPFSAVRLYGDLPYFEMLGFFVYASETDKEHYNLIPINKGGQKFKNVFLDDIIRVITPALAA